MNPDIRSHLDGFSRHLRILKALSEKSVQAYTRKVEEFFAWLEGNDDMKDLRDLKRQDIEKYMEWCFYRGNKNITRFTKLTAVQNFFRYLVYEKIVLEDPTEEIPRPRLKQKFIQRFTKEEILRMFKEPDILKEKGLRDAVILILFAFCGFRMNEVLTITIAALDDDGKHIDIRVKGKQESDRSVYLWAAPSAFVRAYMTMRITQGARGEDPLLVSYTKGGRPKGRMLTAVALDNLIKRLASKAGIRKAEIHAHMFRASHANDLCHVKGYDLPAIQERLGWKDMSTAGRYIPRRERIHRTYNSLHEYWLEFPKIWQQENKGGADANTHDIAGPDAGGHDGGDALVTG